MIVMEAGRRTIDDAEHGDWSDRLEYQVKRQKLDFSEFALEAQHEDNHAAEQPAHEVNQIVLNSAQTQAQASGNALSFHRFAWEGLASSGMQRGDDREPKQVYHQQEPDAAHEDSHQRGASSSDALCHTPPPSPPADFVGRPRHRRVLKGLDLAAGATRREEVTLEGKNIAAPAVTVGSVVVSKERLRESLRCYGQLQQEFILASTCTCTTSARGASSWTQRRSGGCVHCGDSSLLLLFDQHAVDERIQLERLMAAGSTATMQSVTVPQSQLVVDQEALRSVLYERREQFHRWGFEYDLNSSDAIPYGQTLLCLTKAPKIYGETLTVADLLEFAQVERQLGAQITSGPPAAHRIMCNKACKTAVKFGDPLSHDRCSELLHSLVNETELPFQCAHGRPSVVPLLDMTGLRSRKMQSLQRSVC